MAGCFVSGITFIKNGLTLGYPIKESIESIEALTDEIIINVGFEDEALTKDDGTYNYLRDHLKHPKFKFLKSFWNPLSTKNGTILSEQTNIALAKATGKICQYIQGDEIIHEEDYSAIHEGYLSLDKNPALEGLVFSFLHFYGNTDIIKHTRNIYRNEVRAFKKENVKSWLDAQGFRHIDGSKLNCTKINARIFHYGWARKENIMKQKVKTMDKFYHGNQYESQDFEYKKIWGLRKFKGTHPLLMKKWIEKNKNEMDLLSLKLHPEKNIIGLMVSDFIEDLTGYRIGEYKNYKLQKKD